MSHARGVLLKWYTHSLPALRAFVRLAVSPWRPSGFPQEDAMFLSTVLNFGTSFREHFEIVPAVTDEMKRHAYRIRYDVYCRELHFEPENPSELESDAYDPQSLHCLLREVRTENYVGCVRIILTRPEARDTALPFETTCARSLDRSIVDPAMLDRSKVGEVSRLAIVKRYRRRRGEVSEPLTLSTEDFGDSNRPRLPYLQLGLYLGMLVMAQRHGIKTLFMLSEPRLARHLSMLGGSVLQIGAPIEHRGSRVPCMMDVDSIVADIHPATKPLYREVIAEFDGSGGRAPAAS
jgi:N-acyl amino acid synthase of PEP-CTERM/exosortase system